MPPGPIAPEDFVRLVDHHAGGLVLLARQWCRSPEDVVQEAFLSLVRQSEAPRHPAAWLYRAVRNGAISAARSAQRRQARERRRATPEAWFEANDAGLDAEAAAAALADLPLDLREVIVARIWGQLTFDEIGQLIGASLSTAQRRYEQGMRILRRKLDLPCEAKSTTPRR